MNFIKKILSFDKISEELKDKNKYITFLEEKILTQEGTIYQLEKQLKASKNSDDRSEISTNEKSMIIPKNTKLTRSEAKQILEDYIIKNKYPKLPPVKAFSNRIKNSNNWWIEPQQETFKTDFTLILNDHINRKLFAFFIPKNEFNPIEDFFYIRNDNDRVSFTIDGEDTKFFKDLKFEKGVKFNKFLKYTCNY